MMEKGKGEGCVSLKSSTIPSSGFGADELTGYLSIKLFKCTMMGVYYNAYVACNSSI